MGKNMVKQNITFCHIESFASPLWLGLTRETLAKSYNLTRLFIFQSCALHMALFVGKLLMKHLQNLLVHPLKLGSPQSLTFIPYN